MAARSGGRPRLGAVAAGALVATLLAGCSVGAGSTSAAAPPAADDLPVAAPRPVDAAVADYVAGVRAWVGCMRSHGIGLPDPGPRGHVPLPRGAWWKTAPAAVAAQRECAPLHPEVPPGLLAARRPELTHAEIDQARQYSRCMQTHGAPDFPDPGADGYPDRPEPGEPQWDPLSPGARNASRACAHVIGDPALPGPGRG